MGPQGKWWLSFRYLHIPTHQKHVLSGCSEPQRTQDSSTHQHASVQRGEPRTTLVLVGGLGILLDKSTAMFQTNPPVEPVVTDKTVSHVERPNFDKARTRLISAPTQIPIRHSRPASFDGQWIEAKRSAVNGKAGASPGGNWLTRKAAPELRQVVPKLRAALAGNIKI